MRSSLLRLFLFLGVLAVAWLGARQTGLLESLAPARIEATVTMARSIAWIAPAFVVAYALASTLGLPASPFTLAGGAIFGTALGSLLNWMGATLGAAGAYTLSRLLTGNALERLLGRHRAFLGSLTGAQSFVPLLRLRLIPVMPFNALNFGAGLAGVRARPFVLSTALGIIPGTVIYTSFADALLSGATGARGAALTQLALASGLLLALSFAPKLFKRNRSVAMLAFMGAVLPSMRVRAQSSPAVSAAPAAAVDHAPFDAMLRAYVTEGMVDYDAFAADRRFPAYLQMLERAHPERLDRSERLAYWINAYNAYTIQLINTRGERRSIKNINKRFGVSLRSPWSEPIVKAGGRTLSLDDVEHRIIRPEFHEPRIHMALVCAAKGCPPLRSEAYASRALDAQLDDQTRRFLSTPGKNRVDVASRTVFASPIFTWYREDFGGTVAAVGRFWAKFVPDEQARALLESGTFRWSETDYDWSLNLRRAAASDHGRGR